MNPSDSAKTSRREQVLKAALDVLGEMGIHALSHARIDKVAGVPAGTTSNHFRTKSALTSALVQHLAEVERADFSSAEPVTTAEQAIKAFTGMLLLQTGPMRHRTLARYALFTDLADHPTLLVPLIENRKGFETWTSATLEAIGASDPTNSAPFLMATLDGAIMHRLIIDPRLDLEKITRRAIQASLL